MSQLDNPYAEAVETRARTSGLAIAALVCSLILCCPVTTIVGPVLGLVAFAAIGSNPARKGRGLALAAVVIGVIATAVWVVLGLRMYDQFVRPQEEGPRAELTAAFAGDPATFKAGMYGAAAAASDQELAAFVSELRIRYGDFVTCAFDRQKFEANPPSFEEMMQPTKSYPYLLEFDDQTVQADIEISTQDPQTGQFFWRMRFGRILIMDEQRGNLTYPPTPEAEEAAEPVLEEEGDGS